jgi:hypothetical protein
MFQHPVAIAHRQHRDNSPSPWIHEHIHGTTKEYDQIRPNKQAFSAQQEF